MKKVYVVRGSEDGVLGVFTNKKAILKGNSMGGYPITYKEILDGLKDKDIFHKYYDKFVYLEIETFHLNN